MWIREIKLKNFRNYENADINLNKNINIFYGDNAQGKTNIIEAIFLCSLGKSFKAKKDNEMIKIGENNSIVEVYFSKSDREGKILVELSNKKNVYLNGIRLKKLSELLGNLNIVIFTPDDINILKGSPQNRRKFLDIMISQLRPNYINLLNNYYKTIEQRNTYLRQIREEHKSQEMLDIWDSKLADYACRICEYRKFFIDKIIDKIEEIHKNITKNKENIKIEYITDCLDRENYLNLLNKTRKIDIIKGYTTKGIHRDDFITYINGKQIIIYGSQGQSRTAMLSLKLAELQIIYDEIGEYPILLLDDFMSELDKERIKNFLENIKENQVIITGTEKINLENLDYLEYNVTDGKIREEI